MPRHTVSSLARRTRLPDQALPGYATWNECIFTRDANQPSSNTLSPVRLLEQVLTVRASASFQYPHPPCISATCRSKSYGHNNRGATLVLDRQHHQCSHINRRTVTGTPPINSTEEYAHHRQHVWCFKPVYIEARCCAAGRRTVCYEWRLWVSDFEKCEPGGATGAVVRFCHWD